MTVFDRTQTALFQIKDLLLANETLRKLLYNMTPNALNESAPLTDDVDALITVNPFVEDDEGVSESYKNAFIAIYPTDFTPDDNQVSVNITVSCYVTKDYYLLNDRKIRGISIINQIVKILENKKLEFAGKMELINVTSQTVDLGKFIGFNSNWEVVDGKDFSF